MDVKVYIDIYSIPFREAVIRYKANPDEVASRGENEELNLTLCCYISKYAKGAHDITIPTCGCDALAANATDLDRKVYQKLVDEKRLAATVEDISVTWFNGYSGNIPMVDYECSVAGYTGIISGTINPFSPTDTPSLPMFIWEAVAKKASEVVRRFTELEEMGV